MQLYPYVYNIHETGLVHVIYQFLDAASTVLYAQGRYIYNYIM